MYTIRAVFSLLTLCGVCGENMPVFAVQAVSGEKVELPCKAEGKVGVQYMYVSWYRMQLDGDPLTSQRRGLVLRDLPDGAVEHFAGLTREVVLDDTMAILLPNVTCDDGGKYGCFLEAPVGERIQKGMVVLKLSDCKDVAVGNPAIPVGKLRVCDELPMVSLVSIVLVLGVAAYCYFRKRQHDQKKVWKAEDASLQANLSSRAVSGS
ncbi:CD83 antigen [Syngnathoides biaculeatus]|uniref:CD83 antigen n=1 Tax=Syngnathoides biaculeatus TaxID=300417 RepID=UPI002ADD87B9|nr:CD83 antigen [Syngnathoides biaculeatus]